MAGKNSQAQKISYSTAEIRERFLKYFEGQGHRRVASSSLIPGNDPTILFTNAGMNQFKDVFLGLEKRDYARATTVQKCVRAGGKHNDLENVGFTARHHTFFEMLGNFSFGDYFKKDAIAFAWDLVTNHFQVPKDRLFVTVHLTDDESADLWHKNHGVSRDRIFRFDKDNFWQMADTGPCGPCTEIFFDRAPDPKRAVTQAMFEANEHERFMEIWNLVFMQFDQQSDGTRKALPKPSVDTGMGLERMASVLQGVASNYDIDLFRELIAAIEKAVGRPYTPTEGRDRAAFRVIADHLRACSFMIADGIIPSNEGRGYVLRRILRRAIRFGRVLGKMDPFIHQLVAPLHSVMGAAYPELNRVTDLARVMQVEEERFHETLENGLRLLDEEMERQSKRQQLMLTGDFVFKLYDTFGFPLDLTQLICREKSFSVDTPSFEKLLDQQRALSRSSGKKAGAVSTTAVQSAVLKEPKLLNAPQRFVGYDTLACDAAITFLFRLDGDALTPVQTITAPEMALAFVDMTPFYAEGGGQVGDIGWMRTKTATLEVLDTQKADALHHAHQVQWSASGGSLQVGDRVHLEVNPELRAATAQNHSATHLLHAALRQVLGKHVKQSGSRVAPESLRFDFSHFQAATTEELKKIETLVNSWAAKADAVSVAELPYSEALEQGALALFDEKYGDRVRTICMGDASFELCGGTHVSNTKDCFPIKILSESSVAAGVRRLEAKAGISARKWIQEQLKELKEVAAQLGTSPDKVRGTVSKMKQRVAAAEADLAAFQSALIGKLSLNLISKAEKKGEVSLIVQELKGVPPSGWKDLVDRLREQCQPVVILLYGEYEGKAHLVSAATSKHAATAAIHCGQLIQALAGLVGGKGGGRPDMAQAGGPNPSGLRTVHDEALKWIDGKIK